MDNLEQRTYQIIAEVARALPRAIFNVPPTKLRDGKTRLQITNDSHTYIFVIRDKQHPENEAKPEKIIKHFKTPHCCGYPMIFIQPKDRFECVVAHCTGTCKRDI